MVHPWFLSFLRLFPEPCNEPSYVISENFHCGLAADIPFCSDTSCNNSNIPCPFVGAFLYCFVQDFSLDIRHPTVLPKLV